MALTPHRGAAQQVLVACAWWRELQHYTVAQPIGGENECRRGTGALTV